LKGGFLKGLTNWKRNSKKWEECSSKIIKEPFRKAPKIIPLKEQVNKNPVKRSQFPKLENPRNNNRPILKVPNKEGLIR